MSDLGARVCVCLSCACSQRTSHSKTYSVVCMTSACSYRTSHSKTYSVVCMTCACSQRTSHSKTYSVVCMSVEDKKDYHLHESMIGIVLCFLIITSCGR